MAIFSTTTITVTEEPHERLTGAYASANLFQLLGVAPALGRTITRRGKRTARHPSYSATLSGNDDLAVTQA